jgi:hypothetical protein
VILVVIDFLENIKIRTKKEDKANIKKGQRKRTRNYILTVVGSMLFAKDLRSPLQLLFALILLVDPVLLVT